MDGNFFGPLSQEYCLYFYAISVIAFVLFVIGLVSMAYTALMEKNGGKMALMMLPGLVSLFIIYFVNRLLNTMCRGSTQA